MGRRIQQRRHDGRFTRNTLEGACGLRVTVCPGCGQLNPYGRAEPALVDGFVDPASMNRREVPTHCHACGAALPPAARSPDP